VDGKGGEGTLIVRAPRMREWALHRFFHVVYGDSEVLAVEEVMPDLRLAQLGMVQRLHEEAAGDIFGFVV